MANTETTTVGQQLHQLDAIFAGQDMATAAIADLCPIYRRVRPIVVGLIPIVRLFRPSAADALDMLVRLADQACPQG